VYIWNSGSFSKRLKYFEIRRLNKTEMDVLFAEIDARVFSVRNGMDAISVLQN
jgi:hypothetical protein